MSDCCCCNDEKKVYSKAEKDVILENKNLFIMIKLNTSVILLKYMQVFYTCE